MGDVLACLRGWHPALAAAELSALLPNAELGSTPAVRWLRVSCSTREERRAALAVASGLQCFLDEGRVVSVSETDEEAWFASAVAYVEAHPVEGSVAVRGWSQGGKISGWSLSRLSRRLGGALHERGYTVDLEHPERVLALIGDGQAQHLAWGWMEGDGQAAFSNGERRAGERPFFKPVSLDPMLARLAVNVATGPVDAGPVVDPMTGTGGFLIEAALSNRPSLGIDLNSEMAHGAEANLVWACDGPVDHARVVRGDATRLADLLPEAWHGAVAGFVLDPPYGRNSHGNMESLSLLEACLRSARGVAAPTAGFVLILPVHPIQPHPETAVPLNTEFSLLHGDWEGVRMLIEATGWTLQSAHVERVHRSLSRLILHARCAPQG